MTFDRYMIWQETKDYFNITLGLMLYTFGFTVFLLPYQIVTGGIAGIGAIIFYATKFPVQWTFFIINALLIAIGARKGTDMSTTFGELEDIWNTYGVFGRMDEE